jgi:hypothetical protein
MMTLAAASRWQNPRSSYFAVIRAMQQQHHSARAMEDDSHVATLRPPVALRNWVCESWRRCVGARHL